MRTKVLSMFAGAAALALTFSTSVFAQGARWQVVNNINNITNAQENLDTTTPTYDVSFSVSGGAGAIYAFVNDEPVVSSPVTVSRGSKVEFRAIPRDVEWQRVKGWTDGGVPVNETNETYTIASITGARTVAVEFEDIPKSHTAGTPDIRWYHYNADTVNYTINQADQLAGLAQLVNSGLTFKGRTISLSGNISLSSYGSNYDDGKGWVPIGKASYQIDFDSWRWDFYDLKPFSGIFDGNGYAIHNLYIDRPDELFVGLFGYVSGGDTIAGEIIWSGGEIRRLGIPNANITGRERVGIVTGDLSWGSKVDQCYSSGTVKGRRAIGGIVGEGAYSKISNCYSSAAIQFINITPEQGNPFDLGTAIGGIVGGFGGIIENCYSIGAITGAPQGAEQIDNTKEWGVGGILGGLWEFTPGVVTNSAALNVSIEGGRWGKGRVVGGVSDLYNEKPYEPLIEDNVAYVNLSKCQYTLCQGDRAACNGIDISVAEIHSDPTLGGRFADTEIWTTASGKLPGLFGNTVNMPQHLMPTQKAAVADPINKVQTVSVTVGPNPVDRASGAVRFFAGTACGCSQSEIGNVIGSLTIYDVNGKLVHKIGINDNNGVDGNSRIIAEWDLRDKKGRLVGEGTYLVRGRVATADGKREKISFILGVR